MKKISPVLSLCIPTFNRAEILKNTIGKIVSDIDFNEEVELIISDNGSSDNTPEVCEDYVRKYSNVYYYRNKENIKIYNFYKVLSLANGKYLKIINDTCTFQIGKLGRMKEIVKEHDENSALLFPPVSNFVKGGHFISNDINETIKFLSYNATWSPAFGIWKNDFHVICDNTDYESLLPQVDWIYRLSLKKKIEMYVDHYFDVQWTGSKGNFNYMRTFTIDYLNILKQYKFSRWRFEVEKFRLLGLLTHYYYMMRFKNIASYDNSNAFKLLFRKYWYEPYFYIEFPVLILARLFYNKIFKRLSD